MKKNTKWSVCVLVFFMAAGAAWYTADIWMGNSSVIDKELDFKQIFSEAEKQNWRGPEAIAADIAHERLLKYFPLGSDITVLTDYLKSKGFDCSSYLKPVKTLSNTNDLVKKTLKTEDYCERTDGNWRPFTNVIWKVIVATENAHIINIKILAQLDTL